MKLTKLFYNETLLSGCHINLVVQFATHWRSLLKIGRMILLEIFLKPSHIILQLFIYRNYSFVYI